MLFEDLEDRRPFNLVFVEELLEDWRLEDAKPDPEANPDQDDAQEKGNAPAPAEELVARKGSGAEHDDSRQEQSCGHTKLWPRGEEAAVMMPATRPFHRQQHR